MGRRGEDYIEQRDMQHVSQTGRHSLELWLTSGDSWRTRSAPRIQGEQDKSHERARPGEVHVLAMTAEWGYPSHGLLHPLSLLIPIAAQLEWGQCMVILPVTAKDPETAQDLTPHTAPLQTSRPPQQPSLIPALSPLNPCLSSQPFHPSYPCPEGLRADQPSLQPRRLCSETRRLL